MGISDSYMLEAIISTSVDVDAHVKQFVQEQAFTRKQQHEHSSSSRLSGTSSTILIIVAAPVELM